MRESDLNFSKFSSFKNTYSRVVMFFKKNIHVYNYVYILAYVTNNIHIQIK